MTHELGTSSKEVVKINLILFSITLILLCIGSLDSIISNLSNLIEKSPLPNWHFGIFIIFGLIFPISLRILKRSDLTSRKALDPYLILLLGQILTEIILISISSKGAGVIVGLLFTVTRLVQIRNLLFLFRAQLLIKTFLSIQLLLWMINLINIIGNRMIPLIT